MSLRNLEALFAPRSVAVLGPPQTPGQRQLLAHLDTTAPRPRTAVGWSLTGWARADALTAPMEVDLAVAFDGRLLQPPALQRLGEIGCRALIWATDVPADAATLSVARENSVRVLGPRSAGVAAPRSGFNASAFAGTVGAGSIALITQSRTVAAAALDWAEGRALGFSWLAVTGAEADVDLADLLDYAALDPQVRAVVLQLGRIADGRAFMSAARACSRAKPVVVLQTTREEHPAAAYGLAAKDCEEGGSSTKNVIARSPKDDRRGPAVLAAGLANSGRFPGFDPGHRQGIEIASGAITPSQRPSLGSPRAASAALAMTQQPRRDGTAAQSKLSQRYEVATDAARRLRSAAFARAGLIECESLPGLFDAIAALERLRGVGSDRVLVVGNGSGICALGADAVQRFGLTPATVGDDERRRLQSRLAQVRMLPAAVDVGPANAAELVDLLRILGGAERERALLLLHSPGPGQPHAAAARAIAAGDFGTHLLTVWLGLATAQPARRISAAAGVPTFASPDAAAQALAVLRTHRRTQELLTQTPPLHAATRVARGRVAAILRGVSGGAVSRRRTLALLEAYGVGRSARASADTPALTVDVAPHAEFGLYLAVTVGSGALQGRVAYALPPLDGLLVRRLLETSGLHWQTESRVARRLAIALLRLSDLVVEIESLQHLRLQLTAPASTARCAIGAAEAWLGPPLPRRRRLALAPYPQHLAHDLRLSDGRLLCVRPVRPQDEPAVVAMLSQTDPEAIRLRFFRMIRHFSHAMAARLTQVDYDRELVLVATPGDDASARMVALAHLIILPDERNAEYAILVHQDYTGRGLGRHLMQRLLDYAACRCVGRVFGEVLIENRPMLALCRRLGFAIRRDPDDALCMRVEIQPRPIPLPEGSRRTNRH